MQRMKRREYKRELPCKLTEDERAAKGRMLSSSLGKIETMRDDKKIVVKQLSEDIKAVEAEMHSARDCYDTGFEPRSVPCVEFSTTHGTIEVERSDTGEVIETRRAVESEMQLDLPEAKAKAAEKNVKKEAAKKRTSAPKKAAKKPKVPPAAKPASKTKKAPKK